MVAVEKAAVGQALKAEFCVDFGIKSEGEEQEKKWVKGKPTRSETLSESDREKAKHLLEKQSKGWRVNTLQQQKKKGSGRISVRRELKHIKNIVGKKRDESYSKSQMERMLLDLNIKLLKDL